jgi:hypothetical protein
MHVVKMSVLAPIGLLVAVLAAAPVYKWFDEQGNVHYGDQPPPLETEVEEMVLLPAPSDDEVLRAQARLERLSAELELSREARAADQELQRLEEELAEEERIQRLGRCQRAQQNLHVMDIQLPVYSINEKGERVYLDDQARAAEMQRMRVEIEENCD